MKLVIQKVSHASVETEGTCIAEIQKGFLVLVGIGKNDTKEIVDQYVKKMVNLRIFTDKNGKTNLSLEMSTEKFFWYHNLPYMLTAKKEIVQAFLMQEIQKKLRLCMNIW